MIDPQTKQKIVELFGLSRFGAREHGALDAEGKRIDGFWVYMLWAAVIDYFELSACVAVVDSSRGTKGLFFVPTLGVLSPDQLGVLTNPVRTVDLAGWEDPVRQALQSINLTATVGDNQWGYGYSYTIQVCTQAFSAGLNASGPGDDPTFDRLGEAILATVKTIVDQYDDRDMRKFLDTDRHFRR